MAALVSCSPNDRGRQDADARKLGQEAHEAALKVKHDAKEVAHEARTAGKQFRDGWDDAKRNDKNAPKAPQ